MDTNPNETNTTDFNSAIVLWNDVLIINKKTLSLSVIRLKNW